MSRSELVLALERARGRTGHEWMDIGVRARHAHTVSIQRLELDVAFEEDEPLRIEISSKFRRDGFKLEAARAGLRPESWRTDAAGEFAVALLVSDSAAGTRSNPDREETP